MTPTLPVDLGRATELTLGGPLVRFDPITGMFNRDWVR